MLRQFFGSSPTRCEVYVVLAAVVLLLFLTRDNDQRLSSLLDRLDDKLESMNGSQNNTNEIHVGGEESERSKLVREVLKSQGHIDE